jgi:hypothetical protein
VYVYSGECRLCTVGIPTGLSDVLGRLLHTGDIVLTYKEGEDGVEFFGDLTVVVCNQYNSYTDGTHVLLDGPMEFFAMGIRVVPINDTGSWKVRKVKSFEDVIDGEHWKAYGFNYRNR